jgi:hypothetical protein
VTVLRVFYDLLKCLLAQYLYRSLLYPSESLRIHDHVLILSRTFQALHIKFLLLHERKIHCSCDHKIRKQCHLKLSAS